MKSFLLSVLILSALASQAQTETNSAKVPGRTSFYVELGGPGILFSANIDSRFKNSNLGLGFRAGLGFVTADEELIDQNGNTYWEPRSVVTVPVQINYVFGKPTSPHTFEVGGGATYVGKELDIFTSYNEEKTQIYGSASFMYRRQPIGGGFTWRIGFTPLIAHGYIQPSGAIGVGYNF
jgi:hypothetical protein